MDNREELKIGELERNTEVIQLVRPKFNTEIFSNAII